MKHEPGFLFVLEEIEKGLPTLKSVQFLEGVLIHVLVLVLVLLRYQSVENLVNPALLVLVFLYHLLPIKTLIVELLDHLIQLLFEDRLVVKEGLNVGANSRQEGLEHEIVLRGKTGDIGGLESVGKSSLHRILH